MEKFFIVGCPRSGTTMVQQALNRHSAVVIPPETKFFFAFFGHSRARQLRHLRRLNEDLRIDLPVPATRVASISEGRAFYEAMARQYLERVGKKGAIYFGEKTPEHTSHLPAIRQLFPSAKIVVLYRDGRDVAVSLSKMLWASPDVYVNFVVWLYYSWVLRPEMAPGRPDVYCARYEDVVAAPEKAFRGILGFLGLPYEPAVAEGFGNREGVPEREYAWKGRALQKITPDRVGIFRQELTAAQTETLERMGRQALPVLGYPLLTDGKGPLSLGFLLGLSLNLWRFVYRLPWQSVVKELFARTRLSRAGAPPVPLALAAGSTPVG
jgi:hypothetical protein